VDVVKPNAALIMNETVRLPMGRSVSNSICYLDMIKHIIIGIWFIWNKHYVETNV